MLGLRGDISNTQAPFSATGLTGLDCTGTVCSWASWLFIEQPLGIDVDIFCQLKQGLLREGIAIGAKSTGEAWFFVADAAGQTNSTSDIHYLQRGVWAHFGVTWDGAIVRFYRNGVLHSTAAQAGTPTAGGTRGTNALFNSGNVVGRYFDTRWFPNTLLNGAAIKATMDTRRTVTGCKGRWFRNWGPTGLNVTIVDESGNGNNLLTNGNPNRSQTTASPPYMGVIASAGRRARRYLGYRTATSTATKLGFQQEAAGPAASGLEFDYPPIVLIQDAGGATQTGDNSTVVTATITSGAGSLVGTVSKTAVAGKCDWSGLGLGITGLAANVITYTAAGLTSCVNTSITPIAPTYDRDAELPRLTHDTTYPTVIGAQYTVGSGKTYATIQAAYNAAVVANLSTAIELLIDPGTYVEQIQLKFKTNAGEIIFRRAGSHVVAAGTRVSPSNFATNKVKIAIENSRAVVQCDAGACYVRFCGVEIAQPIPAAGLATELIAVVWLQPPDAADFTDIANYPHHIIIDRCYVHGGTGIEIRKGVTFGGGYQSIVDSDVRDIFQLKGSQGGFFQSGDTNAIAMAYGRGPHRIYNNYLSSAGEVLICGGADPFIKNTVPADVTVTRNLFFKQPAWRLVYQAKNNLELKNGRRWLIEGNVFDGSWADAQDGTGILMDSVNQNSLVANNYCGLRDITFRLNFARNMTALLTMSASNTPNSYLLRRVSFHDVLGVNIGSDPGNLINRIMLYGGDDTNSPSYLDFRHCTVLGTPGVPNKVYLGKPACLHSDFTDNILTASSYGLFDALGNAGSAAVAAELPDGTFTKNALIDRVADGVTYPAVSWYPPTNADVGFTNAGITATWDIADPDAVCVALTLTNVSLYKAGNARQSTDAKDVGCDITALRAAIAGVVPSSAAANAWLVQRRDREPVY